MYSWYIWFFPFPYGWANTSYFLSISLLLFYVLLSLSEYIFCLHFTLPPWPTATSYASLGSAQHFNSVLIYWVELASPVPPCALCPSTRWLWLKWTKPLIHAEGASQICSDLYLLAEWRLSFFFVFLFFSLILLVGEDYLVSILENLTAIPIDVLLEWFSIGIKKVRGKVG